MAYSKKISFVFIVSFLIVLLCSTSCFAVEWTDQEIDELLNRLIEMQNVINNLNDSIGILLSDSTVNNERLQIIINNIKSINTNMNSKFDKLQSAASEINTNLLYCLTNLQQIKSLSTEMSSKLDLLQARFKRS